MAKAKRIVAFLLILTTLFALTSCSFADRLKGDMSKLGQDEDKNLLYNDNTYYNADPRFVVVTDTPDETVELGWYSQFPFFPDMHYFAFEEENPTFIFCQNGKSTVYNKGLYVKDGYDIENALFTVEGTDIVVTLSAAMTKSDIDVAELDMENHTDFTMCLNDDPRVQVYTFGPYKHTQSGEWYFNCSGEAWLASDELVAKIFNN